MKTFPVDKGLDGIKIQSGETLFILTLDHLRDGVVPFIEQFGNLYYGNLNYSSFVDTFVNLKNHLVLNLLDIESTLANEAALEFVQFGLHMCKLSREQPQWHWPGTVSWYQGQRYWNTGLNRTLASGLFGGQDQHRLLKILCLDSPDNDINEFLESPVRIRNDQQFNEIFGLSPDTESSHLMTLTARLVRDLKGHTLILELVGSGEKYDPGLEPKRCLTSYFEWYKKYGSRNRLCVYTDWPDLITNTHRAWEVIHAGPSVRSHLGYLENQLKFRGQDGFVDIYPHTLFMVKPTRIDVAELLFWMDLEHSAYIGNDFRYLLYRDSDEYRSTQIRTSNLAPK